MTTTAPAPAVTTRAGRLWFATDAVVSAGNGLAYLAAAGPLADLLGGDATTYRWVGAFLVLYGAAVGLYARSSMPIRGGWAIVVGNAVWTVASLEVAVTDALDLDPAGRGWVVAQALVVAALAVLQGRSLRAR